MRAEGEIRRGDKGTCEAEVEAFLVSLRNTCLVRLAVRLLSAGLLIAGTAILVARMLADVQPVILLGGLSTVVAVLLAVAIAVERRRQVSADAARALLDSSNSCGGLYMARAEDGIDAAWAADLPKLVVPDLVWRGRRRAARLLCAGVIFAAAAMLVPIPRDVFAVSRPMDVSKTVQELKEELALLEQATALESNAAVEIREELDRISEEATGEDPAKAWEALDHLEQSTENVAREAVEEGIAASEQISRAMELTDAAMALSASGEDASLLADTMSELGESLRKCAAEGTSALSLPPDLLNAAADCKLTPDQLAQLSTLLGDASRLSKAKLTSLAGLKFVKGTFRISDRECLGGNCTNALLAMLSSSPGNTAANGKPGRGGANRGRADAEMTWSDGRDESGTAFVEKALPPAQVSALRDSVRVGTSFSTPELDQGAVSTAGASLAAPAGGARAASQQILPRHREAVQSFFERNTP